MERNQYKALNLTISIHKEQRDCRDRRSRFFVILVPKLWGYIYETHHYTASRGHTGIIDLEMSPFLNNDVGQFF